VLGVGFGGSRAGLSRGAAFRLLPVTDAEADELIDSAEGVATELDGFQRRELARLNRLAVRRARAAAAFDAVSRNCGAGLELLGVDARASEHDLAFEIYFQTLRRMAVRSLGSG
jgi:hypothetical protein